MTRPPPADPVSEAREEVVAGIRHLAQGKPWRWLVQKTDAYATEKALGALRWTESMVDACNDFPCLFCQADRYDGHEGIVHHQDCPVRLLREGIARLTGPQEAQDEAEPG